MILKEIQAELHDIKKKVLDWSELLGKSQQFLEDDSLQVLPDDPLNHLGQNLSFLLQKVEKLDEKDKMIIHKDLEEFQIAVEKSHKAALTTIEAIKNKQKESGQFVKAVQAYGKNS